jgi:Glycosyltransferase family 87
VVGAAALAAAVVVAILRVTTLSELFGVRLAMPRPLNDFKAAVYCPVTVFVSGGNPYDRDQLLQSCPRAVYCRVSSPSQEETHPARGSEACIPTDVFPPYLPATLLLHAPFALLSIDAAALAYFLLNVAFSLAVVLFALRLTGKPVAVGDVLLGAGLLLLSRPGQWNLLLGQSALELTLATYIALFRTERAPQVSGLALAVAAYKPTFGIPLGLLMLARDNARAVGWAVVWLAALNLPPALLLLDRAGGATSFFRDLVQSQEAYQAINTPANQVYSVDLPGLVSRWTGTWITPTWYGLLTVLVLGISGRALWALRSTHTDEASRLTASLICVSILLCIHHNAYDLVLLVAPVAFVVRRSLPGMLQERAPRYALLAVVAILGCNYVTTQSVLHRLEGHRPAWLLLASLNGALLVVMFGILLVSAMRYAHDAGSDSSTGRAPAR